MCFELDDMSRPSSSTEPCLEAINLFGRTTKTMQYYTILYLDSLNSLSSSFAQPSKELRDLAKHRRHRAERKWKWFDVLAVHFVFWQMIVDLQRLEQADCREDGYQSSPERGRTLPLLHIGCLVHMFANERTKRHFLSSTSAELFHGIISEPQYIVSRQYNYCGSKDIGGQRAGT